MNYVQCKFQKINRFHTAWIPEQKARLKKFFKLKMFGEWQDGWLLITKSSVSVDEKQLTFLKEKFTNNI